MVAPKVILKLTCRKVEANIIFMFIRPANNLKIRDPILRDHLPSEGRLVEDSAYWHRRLNDGDVEIVTAKAKSEESEKPEKGKTK